MSSLKRAIDLRGAISINVITMIGIGPLVTIPLVIAALGGPLALVGWIAGAVVALCDGLGLGRALVAIPGFGRHLRLSARRVRRLTDSGRALAFLFNWQFLLYAPCLLASGYIGFANYAAYLYPPVAGTLAHDAVAVGIGVLTIALLYRRTSQVSAFGTALAVAATCTVAIVALAGLSHADFAQAFHSNGPLRLGTGFLAGFGSALFVTLYDYVGYADAALLGDEVVRPERTIPIAIVLSVLIVAVLYVLLQIGVLGAVPWRSLLDASGAPTIQSQYVGALVVERTWGRAAAVGVTLLVLVTAFASLYGNMLGFSRISFAAARDGAFLPAFARLHPRKEIPHVALLAVGALSLVASLFTLDQVIAFLTAGIVLIQGVAQIAALALVRARRGPAPFAMPLYPLPAIVALAGWTIAFVSVGPDGNRTRYRLAGLRLRRLRPRGPRAPLVAVSRGPGADACTPSGRSRRRQRLVGDVERGARDDRPRLSGLHRQRTAVLRLRRCLLLRAHAARPLAPGAARIQAPGHQHDRPLRDLELARARARRARLHRQHRSGPRSVALC